MANRIRDVDQAVDIPAVNEPGRIVGILGGMGPAATADFYAKLVRATPARTDQEHLRTLIWSDPTIPDRTGALLHGGVDPTPLLLAGALRLRAGGASVIAVPCNTAHAFIPRIASAVGLPFVHMIEETVLGIRARHPNALHVGLLSTTGTQASLLYDEALRRHGLIPVVPTADAQEFRVMAGIARVKAGVIDAQTRALVTEAAGELVQAGAELVIAGCTELPIALEGVELTVPVVDPTLALAEAVVRVVRHGV
ncbi:aspartate/glutamate racemase family protein [Microterricola viridarii]|uniref:Aspartate racemase n=1 Tax=Microterricola viridarii TaxID=412690 RepID=A0A0X8E555_9MICO|nr:amino acid racemase [Microterricola viridarii]AMB59608.1 aspartate racemase [Microterricola viridarii]